MTDLTLRRDKDAPLTNDEVDDNFQGLETDKIELVDLSVTTGTASGSGSLSYDNTSGVFSFTPPDVANFIEAETDTLDSVTGRGNTTTNAITVGDATADSLQLSTSATEAAAVGKLRWDSTQGTYALGLVGGNVESDIGQSIHVYVTNAESVGISKGQVVYQFGAQGDRPTVKLAYNTSDATSAKTLGFAAENIAAGQTGLVISHGIIDGLNTASFTAGDTLYLANTAGAITNVKPQAPNHMVYLGVVARSNAGSGIIYVKVQNGYELDEIHDVQITSLANNDIIKYDSATAVWKNINLNTAIGQAVSPTSDVQFADITSTGNVQIDGDLTVSGTTVTISATNLAVEDNMIYLNDGSTVSNPDLGFAGNYNDGSYKHAGFFRDATDGRWKVYDSYTLEPDASAYIDTSHASFNLANIQAGTFYGALSGNASTASTLQTARTISLTGDVTGSVSFNGGANVSITTAIQPNSIALGTDTTGNYVAGATAGTGVTISGTAGEGWSPTISIGQAVATNSNVTFQTVSVGTNTVTTTSDIALSANAAINTENSLSFGMTDGSTGYYRWLFGNTSKTGGTAGGTEKMKLDASGNLTLSGTVDGRDVAADGTKLDGIEAGATADQTAAEILTAIKTVDGTGSGLDADLLDGQEGTYYAAASSLANYLPKDVTNTNNFNFTGTLSNAQGGLYVEGSAGQFALQVYGTGSISGFLDAKWGNWDLKKTHGGNLEADHGGTLYTVWDAYNDGTGSGLDADLLDGQEGSYYTNASNISSGTLSNSRLEDIFKAGTEIPTAANLNDYRTTGYYSQNANADAAAGSNYPVAFAGILEVINDDTGNGAHTVQRYTRYNSPYTTYHRYYYSGSWGSWSTNWDSNNDGTGSGLDADLLDGQHGSYYQAASSALTTSTTFGGDVSGTYNAIVVADDSHNHSSSTGSFTANGTLTSTGLILGGVANPEITFNGTSDTGVDMAIKATPEGLDIYEPEDTNKIHFRVYDDTGVDAPFGYWVNGTRIIDASRNFTNVASIAMSGTGTVDGRDVSVDGAKLDGIEAGATADQTAAEILAAIVTVDGTGSGLDADLLDGQHGSYYQPAATALGYVDVATGNFGTIKVDDDRGVTYAGYAIRGDWVFMSNNASTAGIYNDTDNEWAITFSQNGSTTLYYDGTAQFSSQSGYAFANNQIRSPIFYDSDNTAYYVDPANATTSGNVAGTINAATFNATSTTNGGFQGIDADTVAAPSFTWTADLNTGMYRYGTDIIGFAAGGNDEFRIYTSYTLSPGSSRAPIFYDSNNTSFFIDPASSSTSALFNGTVRCKNFDEAIYTLNGTALDPGLGGIQFKTLTANTTFTNSFEVGESMTLRLNGGATYTVTWPTMTWITSGGNAAPTLNGTNDVIVLWQETSTLYGAYVGYGA